MVMAQVHVNSVQQYRTLYALYFATFCRFSLSTFNQIVYVHACVPLFCINFICGLLDTDLSLLVQSLLFRACFISFTLYSNTS